MPKIEVYEKTFYDYVGRSMSTEELEAILPVAKAELDGRDEKEGILKIELNDTNRPDLWSTAGLARQLRIYLGGQIPAYDFFSTRERMKDPGSRRVIVEESVRSVRPYIVAFEVSGKKVDEASLKDIIQTQEKLCWNFGRKRKSIAMGFHRAELISYPIHYRAADPDATKFVPLGMTEELSLRQILERHPKGVEFGQIVADYPAFPYLHDDSGETISFPPVINSARIGGVKVGNDRLFVDITGTDIKSLMLAAAIVACDLTDSGFTILPVSVEYPYDTPMGRRYVTPYYFQREESVELKAAEKLLGVTLKPAEAKEALRRMGVQTVDSPVQENGRLTIRVPEYRNDFLHQVDIIEDIMIGRGMSSFEPVMPKDFTVGRLSGAELFARKTKLIMVGLGFQEMIYNYLSSRKEYIEQMYPESFWSEAERHIVRIANPMTENYEYVRCSTLPALLASESVSGNAVYPHKIFEVGKVAYIDESENTGTKTSNYLGFLASDRDANFNQINSFVNALFYFLVKDYTLKESEDPRFISGRSADIVVSGKKVGIFGEIHPEVLTRWGITMPCVACELDLDSLA
ncbi:MAG TPA: phenylalanine--tRNA ligase subunit beta [Spirochaetia bacterium]|nr:phenylalanine--tRNA ligase subunit beta [Spirochaetia bacterium]